MSRVYLDHNATTPLKPAVIEKITELMVRGGNASAIHTLGREARRDVERAREALAALVSVQSPQVIFTAGATESNNTVLRSFADQVIWACATEHPSVLALTPEEGRIPVLENGVIDMDALDKMLADLSAPALVSIMMVNNETGVIQPVEEVARKIKARHPSVYIHTDAVQAAGRIPINFPAMQVDYMSLSAHKMGGPQGVGALIFAPGCDPKAFMQGGGQEKRLRAGTENVPGIAGFGVAAELAVEDMEAYRKLEGLREKTEAQILAAVPAAKIWGVGAPRVANTISLCFPLMAAKSQMMNLDLDGIGVSSGSACASGSGKGSTVLQAMGASEEEAKATLRISLGWSTTEEDVEAFLASWLKLAERVVAKERAV